MFVSLTNVPYTSVFRAHPRLNAEYEESGPRNVSAHVSNLDYWAYKWTWSNDARAVQQDNAALTRIESVTLRFQPDQRIEGADCKDLLEALIIRAPNLRTIRVVEYAVLQAFPNKPGPEIVDSIVGDVPTPLPSIFGPLPLIQRANCRLVTMNLISEPQPPPETKLYGIVQYRAHVYSKDCIARNRLRSRDILYGKLPESYKEWVGKLYKEGKIEMKDPAEKVIGWKEESYGGNNGARCGCECGCKAAL